MILAPSEWRRLLAAASLTQLLCIQSIAVASNDVDRCSAMASAAPIFDYVIVGSGPGGSVMAHRLTENPDIRVAVIEAGTFTEDVVGNLSTVPGYNGAYDVIDPSSPTPGIDWGFITTPQSGMNGLRSRYIRGKCLGGSSNLNAMAWSDNPRAIFHRWAEQVGDRSWEFDTVTKYFARAMNFTPPSSDTRPSNATPDWDPSQASAGGPLSVSFPAYSYSWASWMRYALSSIGLPRVDSFINGGHPLNGSAWMVNTVNHTTGDRASADRAYLRPILNRHNLFVFDKTFAERIVFKGTTATGVKVSATDGGCRATVLRAKREVIVSAGAFQSPQLLQVSGVGPRAALEAKGIKVVVDRPGVGQNLNDGFIFGLAYQLNLDPVNPIGGSRQAVEAARLFNQNATGPLTSPGGEYAGFEKIPRHLRGAFSKETEDVLATYPAEWPEAAYLTVPFVTGNGRNFTPPSGGGAYGTIYGLLQTPTSVGNVSINSSSMRDAPIINPNWLTTRADIEVSVAMFRRIREAWGALVGNITLGYEYFPGVAAGVLETDEQIAGWLRNNVNPIYHASATNKMGKRSDPMAVVDPKGKVYGTDRLRVVDVSAFPFLFPGTAPQAGVYMLSEKISDDVKRAQRRPSFLTQFEL